MGFFIKQYDFIVDMEYAQALETFKNNLDDITKKGYSLSGNTVIYNSDHNSKYFSGEYKNGCFVVRQTDKGTDDFYFRLLPKHEIYFESDGAKTKISVKSKNILLLTVFLVILAVTLLLFVLTALLISSIGNPMGLFLFLIPIVIMGILAAISRSMIGNTEYTLKNIFK